jgi:hypothetical protein
LLAASAALIGACLSSCRVPAGGFFHGEAPTHYELIADGPEPGTLPSSVLERLRIGVGPFRHVYVRDGKVHGSVIDFSPDVIAALQDAGFAHVVPVDDYADLSFDYVVVASLVSRPCRRATMVRRAGSSFQRSTCSG